MKCSHCSAELPASATYCFQCGHSLQSATQSASSHDQPGSFSYLPAGTPPWPTVVPAHAAATTNVVQPGPVELKATSQPKRSVASVLTMIGLALLIPILGAAITMGTLFAREQVSSNAASTNKAPVAANHAPTPQATPTTTNQLPTPTSSKKISDADLNILLQYPNNWDPNQVYKTSYSTSLDIHPHDPLGMFFHVEHWTTSMSSQFQSTSDVNQTTVQALLQQLNVSTIQPIQSATPQPTIGGTTWLQQEGAFQASNGTTYHVTVISTQHNKSYYVILYVMPQAVYTEAMDKYMQPMVHSLQFIK